MASNDMRRVAVTVVGIMAIVWGGALALINVVLLALVGSPFNAIAFAFGALIAALGLVAIRRWG